MLEVMYVTKFMCFDKLEAFWGNWNFWKLEKLHTSIWKSRKIPKDKDRYVTWITLDLNYMLVFFAYQLHSCVYPVSIAHKIISM